MPPAGLYLLDPSTGVEGRLRELEQLAWRARGAPPVRAFAARAQRAAAHAAVARGRAPTTADAARELLAATQRLPFRPDPPGPDGDAGEWMQPVVYTLRYGGDCEDLATALVVVAREIRIPAQDVWITQRRRALNHVTAVLWVDGAWRWADPSIPGARLGESPYQALERLGPSASQAFAA
jgi:transglutaminase-like putative cysteine protease